MDREGGCRCGAVRYRARGEPRNQRVCHCRRCQRAIGAPCNARLLFDRGAVTLSGEVAGAAVSAGLDVGFCARCGTTLFVRRPAAQTIALTSGSLDDPTSFRPTMHVHTASRQPWLVLDDGLPQHPGAAPG